MELSARKEVVDEAASVHGKVSERGHKDTV